jgi:predicted Zn-dependent protease
MPDKRRRNAAARWLWIALFASAAWSAGCATNPATGKKQLSFVSRDKELEMGRQSDPAVIQEYGLYGDSALAKYVQYVGMRVAKASHLPDLEWHFRLLDSPVVNAFAIPGGYIYITRGILAYMNSEAQLAGVLGHEIGHVTARHTAQQMTQEEIAQVGLIAGTVLVSQFRPYSGIAAQSLGLLFLKYSRDHETQADELGVQYAVRAGYDPREIPSTYATLKRIGERQGQSIPSFLETHPDPGDREVRTRQLALASVSTTQSNLAILAPEYRKRIEGLVFGDDPRAGFFESNRFYHPGLEFQIILPAGWTYQNTPSALLAASQQVGASMQITLGTVRDSTVTPAEYVDSLAAHHAIAAATGRPEAFRDYAAWVGAVAMPSEGGAADAPAGFVRIHPGQFLEIIGQAKSTQGVDQIYQSIRSIAALSDSIKLNVGPDLISITQAKRTATFSEIWGDFGHLALSVEDGAILNGTRGTSMIQAGTPLKIVKKGSPISETPAKGGDD